MFDLLVSALAGVVFGIALAAPPGPMNAIIAEESILRGWTAGFRAGLGAMTADLIFCGLALVGVVAIVEQVPVIQTVMIAIGGVLMCYFAYDAFNDARGSFLDTDVEASTAGFRKTFILALTNPYQILFWLTIGVGMLRQGTLDVLAHVPSGIFDASLVVQTGSPALLIGFFIGIFIWVTGYPAGLVALGERIDAAAPTVALLSALVLAAFGVGFLIEAATTVL